MNLNTHQSLMINKSNQQINKSTNQQIKTIILTFTLFLSSFYTDILSQPILTGLSQNPQLFKEAQKRSSNQKGEIEYENVKLPFFDDFSYNSPYPDPALWLDRQAFVNRTFPIRPPTIGVVTLDALNEFGEIYPHAMNMPFPADTLTSRSIRLDSIFNPKRPIEMKDSLYFSFYYQPGGGCETYPPVEWERIGNQPDKGDLLILEFGYNTGDSAFYDYEYTEWTAEMDYHPGDSILIPFFSDTNYSTYYYFTTHVFEGNIFLMPYDSLFRPVYVWNEVWRTDGCSLDSWLAKNKLQYFKQVMIPILDTSYLRDNFQFRFRNYASLEDKGVSGWAGNVDQWHIDYVRLDRNRSYDDTAPNDVTFVSPTTSILKNYQAMPWNQFKEVKQSDYLKSSFYNQLANISSLGKLTRYGCTVIKNGMESVGNISFNEANADPYDSVGLHENSKGETVLPFHINPSINFQLPLDASDSAYFVITHIFEMVGSGDVCTRNDTCIHIQKFYNYYAYDDGTAEAGYSLLSTMVKPHAYLAMRFDLAKKDTLRAVRIWFNRVLNDANFAPFIIKVWDVNKDGLPGKELYTQEAVMPRHAHEYFDFETYFLENPIEISGSFFVGFYQNHPVQLNIGFDQNNDARERTFYKTAVDWNMSLYKGTPMIRPVMGKMFSTNIPERKEKEKIQVTIYPNPTTGQLTIRNYELGIMNYEVFDIMGRRQKAESRKQNEESHASRVTCHEIEIDISHLPAGVYFVRIQIEKEIVTKKVIKN